MISSTVTTNDPRFKTSNPDEVHRGGKSWAREHFLRESPVTTKKTLSKPTSVTAKDPRFSSSDREEKCAECGHPRREHVNCSPLAGYMSIRCIHEGDDGLRKCRCWWERRPSEEEKAALQRRNGKYTRFQPNPRKYSSNAERQRAYRERKEGT